MCRLTSQKCGSSPPPPSASPSPAPAAATGSLHPPARSRKKLLSSFCCSNRKPPPSRPLPQEAPLLVFEAAPALSQSSSPTRPVLLCSESSPLPSSSRSAGLSLTPSPPPHSPFLRSGLPFSTADRRPSRLAPVPGSCPSNLSGARTAGSLPRAVQFNLGTWPANVILYPLLYPSSQPQ